jgi:hypothetical protein
VDDTAETWTYATADAPTFTFTVATDLTTKYTVGSRIKLTQTTVKYFIVTAVSYSNPNTLANAAISANFHSYAKVPQGFPVAPNKWSVSLSDTSSRNQASPVANTVYNPGNLSISIPIGYWIVYFHGLLDFTKSSTGIVLARFGISTANNSFSATGYLAGISANDVSGLGNPRTLGSCVRMVHLAPTTKTTYYLVAAMNATGSEMDLRGDLADTEVRALCGYL